MTVTGGDVWAAKPTNQEADSLAASILADSGVQGGLVVHIGCGDGKLAAALGDSERYLVHGLESDPRRVDQAREYVRSQGCYGRISIEQFDGERLPYSDQLVNLAIVEDRGALPMAEVMRVLAPGGVAYFRTATGWEQEKKAWPDEIDEWTHFLYDATGNAVSNDFVAGPPRRMQWDAGPKFARGHENLGSVSAAVSAAGRVFYIADEGPIASALLPPNWQLIARDAFNGVLLWKRAIKKWEWHLRPFRSGPPQLPRRLVSVGDVVYVTLGYGEPVSALNAATGELLRNYEGTEGTEEIVYSQGVLYLVVGDTRDQQELDAAVRRGEALPAVKRRIAAIKADSGSVLWETPRRSGPEIFALTLAVSGSRAFYQDTEGIVALDAINGDKLWNSSRPARLARRAWASPTLVAFGDVVISADQQPPADTDDTTDRGQHVQWEVTLAGGGQAGEMVAYCAKTGELLWRAPCQQTYNAPPDILISDGLLWTGKIVRAREPGITQARDPVSGEVVRERPADQATYNVGMGHHRCYRNKATCRYLVMGRSGVELVNVQNGEVDANQWVRGTCQLGVVPANGMIYVPPHTCGCFIKAKLTGFNALAPAGTSSGLDVTAARLQRGPAYGQTENARIGASRDSWPTLRHDAARSGATSTTVSSELHTHWKTKLGGKLTALTIDEGRVFVAQPDEHTVYALDQSTGNIAWHFVAGGPVDSPPTIHDGTAIFGSADGHVYCVRTFDGQLVWKLRAAPGVRRIVSYGRLESAWPVSGSVLVLDGVVYCAAGRSSYLDDGLRLCRIDASTGELLSQTSLRSYDEDGQLLEQALRVRGTEMPGALNDVLSSDGSSVFLMHHRFDLQGVEQEPDVPHIFSSVGFLDDLFWHRTYWIYGTNVNSGWGGWWRVGNRVPAGRLLAMTEKEVFGFGRSFMPSGNAYQWRKGEFYRYFAAPREFEVPEPKAKTGKKRQRRSAATDKSIVPTRWSNRADLEARAMVLAGDTLFVAGPLGDTHNSLDAFHGQAGIRLRAMSTRDGSVLRELELDAMPVFDGLAGASGKLYLSTKDGQVRCLGDK
jgi:outer membrane protein assembly factor BamB